MLDWESIALRLRDALWRQVRRVLSFRFLWRVVRSLPWLRLLSIGTVLSTLYLIKYICYSFRREIMCQIILLFENVLWLYYIQIIVMDNRYPLVQRTKELSVRGARGIVHVVRNMRRYCEEASRKDRERRRRYQAPYPSCHKVPPSSRSSTTADTDEADGWSDEMVTSQYHTCGTPLHVQFEAPNEEESECSGARGRDAAHPAAAAAAPWTEDSVAWQVIALTVPLLHGVGRTHEQWDVVHRELSLLCSDRAQPALSPQLLTYMKKSPSFRDDLKALMMFLKADPHLVRIAVKYVEACQQTRRYREYKKAKTGKRTATSEVVPEKQAIEEPKIDEAKADLPVEQARLNIEQKNSPITSEILLNMDGNAQDCKDLACVVSDGDVNEQSSEFESTHEKSGSETIGQELPSLLDGIDIDRNADENNSCSSPDIDGSLVCQTSALDEEESPRSVLDEDESDLVLGYSTTNKLPQEPMVPMDNLDIANAMAPGKIEGSCSSALDEGPVYQEYKQKGPFSIATYRKASPLPQTRKLMYGPEESFSMADDDDGDESIDDGKLPGYQTAWKQTLSSCSGRSSKTTKKVGFDESSFVTDDEPSTYDEYAPGPLSVSRDSDMYGYGGYDGSYTDADEEDLDYGYG